MNHECESEFIGAKIFYQPLEVAIRWAGLLQFEKIIVQSFHVNALPTKLDIPGWSRLLLACGRIKDAIIHGELKCGISGFTSIEFVPFGHPNLTIRHVDLKSWMIKYYPEQRPGFLFDSIERQLHSHITIESVQALLVDRDLLRVELSASESLVYGLQAKIQSVTDSKANRLYGGDVVGQRGERTYLNIIGGLLWLLLRNSEKGSHTAVYATQEAIVNELSTEFGDRPGMSTRTLWAKFAAAKRQLDAS